MSLVTAVKLNCVAFAALPLLPAQVSQSQRKKSKRGQSRGGRDGEVMYALSSRRSVEVQREEKIEFVEEILSGEWPESFSILNFEDLSAYYEPLVFKAQAKPSILLAEVMSEHVYTATPEQLLGDIDHHFAKISGLPIINKEMKCIGVLSKKDKRKASNGRRPEFKLYVRIVTLGSQFTYIFEGASYRSSKLKSKVGEAMSSPVITLSADKTVLDAAILMLKHKINRIPIVNGDEHVVGIVTRTDIFNALEGFSV